MIHIDEKESKLNLRILIKGQIFREKQIYPKFVDKIA